MGRQSSVKLFSGEQGSIELVVIGLLAAFIIVLAIPLIGDVGDKTHEHIQDTCTEVLTHSMQAAGGEVPSGICGHEDMLPAPS